MISVISLFDEKGNGCNVTCAISTSSDVIVQEIEGILTSIYEENPDKFIDALDVMQERIEKKCKGQYL